MCTLNVFVKNIKTGGDEEMIRNEKFGDLALKLVKKITRNEAERVKQGWPPICMGIGHQPKRPQKEQTGWR